MLARTLALSKLVFGMLALFCFAASPLLADDDGASLKKFKTVKTIANTVPSNGDVNPYGLVRVPRTTGNLVEGNYLVSNFNANTPAQPNLQGTGSTIVQISPGGGFSLFAHIDATKLPGPCPGGVGLTTALVVLKTGWVIVGSLPTADGMSTSAQAGCLIVLDSMGTSVETIYGSLINGPWDMTAADADQHVALFVTNVLNGTVAAAGKIVNQATVVRLDLAVSQKKAPWLEAITVIGSGFPARTDPAALVIGPTGVGLSPNCKQAEDPDDCEVPFGEDEPVLYEADSLKNRVTLITDPLTRTTSAGTGKALSHDGSLNDPLGFSVGNNGHIFVVNGNDGFVTEITATGAQVAKHLLDNTVAPPPAPPAPPGAGSLFGVLFDPEVGLVFVDDVSNTLDVFQ